MSFAQPGQGGDQFDLKTYGDQWMGSLMLVWPISLKPNFDSGKYEPTDVVECDIALIDRINPSTGKPAFFKNAFLFSKGLVSNTRGEIGNVVLGRLVKKQFANGVGWSLEDFTPADEQAANAYMLAHPRQAVAQPQQQQQQQAPPSDAWAGMDATPSPPPAAGGWGASAQQATGAASGQWGAPAASAAAPTPAASPPAATPPPAWGAPAPTPAGPPAPPAGPSNGIENWPPGLADYLKAGGVDPAQVSDQATAEMIARSLPRPPQ